MKISHYSEAGRQAGRPGYVMIHISPSQQSSCHVTPQHSTLTQPSPDNSPNKSQTRYEQPLTSPEPRGRTCHVFIINLYEESRVQQEYSSQQYDTQRVWRQKCWWFYSRTSICWAAMMWDQGGTRWQAGDTLHYPATLYWVCMLTVECRQAGRRIISQRFVCPAQTETVSAPLLSPGRADRQLTDLHHLAGHNTQTHQPSPLNIQIPPLILIIIVGLLGYKYTLERVCMQM